MLRTISIIAFFIVAANFFIANSNNFYSAAYPVLDTLETLEPKNHYTIENQLITTILSRYHYKKVNVDDSLSSITFDNYIKALDYGKNYFLKSDIEEFKHFRYTLDDHLLKGDILPFYDIFNRLRQRMRDRILFIDTVLASGFDFTKNEIFLINREDADWAESYAELNEIWRERIKNDALNLKLNGKEWDDIVKNLKKRYESYSRILTQYNSEDVFQIAMNAYSTAIDPHTNYLSPITSENFKIDMSLSLEGIGARLMSEDGYTTVVEIIPGGPAYKSDLLHVDDKIVAVAQGKDGAFVDVVGWRITDVVKLIRGPKESVVRLQILPAEKGLNSVAEEISLVRDKVKLEDQSAKSEIIEVINNGLPYKIGVIDIPKFYTDFEGQRRGEKNYKSTTRDVKKLLLELEAENVDGIVIDLRNDGGGSLTEAIDVTGLFIEEGPVVQVRNSDGSVDIGEDLDPSIIYDGPLAVLVNRFSASASEIFAGAIQDYGRGIIVGEQTYGKGTVQNLIDLNRLAASRGNKLGQVKLTIAKYYRIDGSSTQNLGVIPDISFPSYVKPDEFGESSELTALPWDQIERTDYEPYGNLADIIPMLIKSSEKRRADDPEFNYLLEDINHYKSEREKKYISLNEEVRRKEKEEEEEKEFLRENERRKKKGLRLLEKDEVPEKNEDEVDPFLNESAMIIADMIRITNNLTKIN